MALRESVAWVEFLENVVQFGWLGTPTNSSSLQLEELGMNHIKDQDGSWMKIILKYKYVSRIVWMMELFL